MSPRILVALGLSAILPLTSVGFAPGDSPAEKAPMPVPAKLERKNFVEKVSGLKSDQNTKQRIPLEGQFEMVYIPGGDVTIGSPVGEAGRLDNEGPQYKARVGNFWMMKYELTWNDYDVFWFDEAFPKADQNEAKALGPDAVTRPTNTFLDETYDHGRDGHPALSMTHHAAMMYCHWLRKKTGRPYRLPTEAEWEYAARGGKGDQPYFFGSDPAELGEYAWFKANSPDPDFPDLPKGCTHKVGTKKPNPFGIYDLYGNVWEWTLDQYDPKTYETRAKNPLNIGPVKVPTADKWSHVVRGGSWADKPDRLRSAARRVSEESWQKHDPQQPRSIWWLTKMDVIGFRVILPETEQPELLGLTPKVVKK